MAKDFYHNQVLNALIKDGWEITADPYQISIEGVDFDIDLAAEPIVAAEKGEQKIAVEIKSFVGPSTVNEFHRAVGQFNDYYVALELNEPDRILYLAIPENTYKTFFSKHIIKLALKRIDAKLIIYEPEKEEIIEWIK
jgi:hypothetical protein